MPAFHLTTPSAAPSVFLYGIDGSVQGFASPRDLAQFLGRHRLEKGDLGVTFRTPVSDPWDFDRVRVVPHVAEDADGVRLTPADLLAFVPRRPRGWFDCPPATAATYRRDPVPRTGHRRGTYGDLLRSPRTRATLREARFSDPDGGPGLRPCRARLPTRWDDRVRSDHRHRSWKHCRAHQWKKTPDMGVDGAGVRP